LTFIVTLFNITNTA